MDWKKEAAQKLRDYEKRKAAQKTSGSELAALRDELRTVRSSLDGEPRRKSRTTADDVLVTLLALIDEQGKAAEINSRWVDNVEQALRCLTPEQYRVLELFYIHPAKGNVDVLCSELHIEIATAYRRRDEALRAFTLALYGATET